MSLQEVENAIRVMNQAAFQELGDLFMISRDSDYNAFVCTGSPVCSAIDDYILLVVHIL